MIPERLVRVVPRETSDEVEQLWAKATNLHPEWEHVTLRDPINPADFPRTAKHWARCTSGAQMAGLVRLEEIATRGGFYLDADFELYRHLTPLLPLSFVAGWEDRQTVPDFFFGAEAGHPVFEPMISDALASLKDGAWQSGPGVFTRALPGRADVLLLPPGAFAPYHYNERHRRWENHHDANPWGFGAHHWAFSWAHSLGGNSG